VGTCWCAEGRTRRMRDVIFRQTVKSDLLRSAARELRERFTLRPSGWSRRPRSLVAAGEQPRGASMTSHDDVSAAGREAVASPDRHPGAPTRRRVLQGAVGAAALVAGTGGMVAAAGDADATPLHPDAGREQIMAHVRDLHTGAIDVFVGTRRITIHDRELAVRLANAAR
jgi:hypothetical protein